MGAFKNKMSHLLNNASGAYALDYKGPCAEFEKLGGFLAKGNPSIIVPKSRCDTAPEDIHIPPKKHMTMKVTAADVFGGGGSKKDDDRV